MTTPNVALLGLPAYDLTSEAFGIAGGSPEKLDTIWPWDRARCGSYDPLKTYMEAVPGMPRGYYGPTVHVGGVMVVNHTLALGATARTIFLGAGATGYASARIAPNGITTGAGWSGVVGNIQEDPFGTPDADSVDDAGIGGTLTVAFDSPARTPRTGAAGQLFRVRLTYTSPPTSIQILLAEAGTPIGSAISFAPRGSNPIPSSGTVLLAPWDAADLGTADGSATQMQVIVIGGANVSIESCDWECSMVLSAGSILWDSGWTAAMPDREYTQWGATVPDTVGFRPQSSFAHMVARSPNNPGETSVSQVAKVVTFLRDPLNALGYIDIGRYLVAPAFVPSVGFDQTKLLGAKLRDTVNISEGGGRSGVRREVIRTARISLSMLPIDEANLLYERAVIAGGLTPFGLVVIDSDEERWNTSLYGCFTSLPDLGLVSHYARRASAFEFEEAL